MNQINFTELFFEYFKNQSKGVHYELRTAPNLLHDLAFMSSLVHDASFYPNKVEHLDNNITILLDRDRWELRYENDNLTNISSCLIITNVQRTELQGIDLLDPEERWIDYLWIAENYRGHDSNAFDFIVAGDEWKMTFKLLKYESDIILKDIEKTNLNG